MEPIRVFVADHPAVVPLLLFPVLVALVTLIFAPRSFDDPSRRPGPRVEGLWMVLAGAGVDAPKMVEGIIASALGRTPKDRAAGLRAMAAAAVPDLPKIAAGAVQIITGRRRDDTTPRPPAPPLGPLASLVLRAGLLIVLVGALVSCSPSGPAQAPREAARSTVLVLSYAVSASATECAAISLERTDEALAKTCVDAYDIARAALSGAAEAVDGWESGAAGNIACAALRAADALSSMVDAIRAAGGSVPPSAADALKLAPALAGVCRG